MVPYVLLQATNSGISSSLIENFGDITKYKKEKAEMRIYMSGKISVGKVEV